MFNQKKNKKFNYKPRFSKSENEEIKQQMDFNWKSARNTKKGKVRTLPMLLVVLGIIIAVMYYLELKMD